MLQVKQVVTKRRILQLLKGLHAGDEQTKEQTVAELERIDKDQAVPILFSVLFYPRSGNIRCDAALALLLVDQERGVENVLPLLRDKLHYVRWFICGLMHDFGDERAIEPLIERMKNDPDPQVRGTAAYALGRIGNSQAIPLLLNTANFDHEVDRLGFTPSDCARTAIDEIQAKDAKMS